MRLESRFLRLLASPCGIRAGQGVVTAVSGGPDSMALLHLLADARRALRIELIAVWIDHGLRPLETPQERETVAAAAEQLGISFLPRQASVAVYAVEKRLSIEHAARELRYAILREAARSCGAELIAVGHTADDQAEELLLRLLRGSGRKGLAGMSMRNGDIIRPLLRFSKQELLAWLERRGIAFCYDSSNSERKFLRNRVRHELLPFLEERFEPGIRSALLKTADSLTADEDLLEELTGKAWDETVREEGSGLTKLLRQPFRSLRPALQRRVMEQLLWRLGSRADYEQILLLTEAALQGRNRSELHLSGGLRAGIFADRVEFSYPAGRRAWRGRLLPAPNRAPSAAPPAPAPRQKPN
ncbi:tRNA lysidine(34) synthetase TilS [Candidatus Electronema sp. JC]|uniref:tRNA lysidine(34) synthetase TilS n=1 Tax=Candidatus Electronema sp. JC TaxID=3401570 RepID=UPI003B436129